MRRMPHQVEGRIRIFLNNYSLPTKILPPSHFKCRFSCSMFDHLVQIRRLHRLHVQLRHRSLPRPKSPSLPLAKAGAPCVLLLVARPEPVGLEWRGIYRGGREKARERGLPRLLVREKRSGGRRRKKKARRRFKDGGEKKKREGERRGDRRAGCLAVRLCGCVPRRTPRHQCRHTARRPGARRRRGGGGQV